MATLMIATIRLARWCQAGRLPDVLAGTAFWANNNQVTSLQAGNLASLAPANTPAPPAEPPYTANQIPGFGVATSNCSH